MGGDSGSNSNLGFHEDSCIHYALPEGPILHSALYNLTGIETKTNDVTTVTQEMRRLSFKIVAQNFQK